MVNLAKKAEQLGLLDFPKTALYCGAGGVYRDWKWFLRTYKPYAAEAIRMYLATFDNSVSDELSLPDRVKSLYYLAPKIKIYVEVDSRVDGFWALKESNYALRIRIFCDSPRHLKGLAIAVNGIFQEGVIKGTNWSKVEKIFEVDRKKCISDWEKLLD